MKNIWNLTLHELRLFFISRGNLVGLLIIPVAFTLVVGMAGSGGFGGGDVRIPVDVVDNDSSTLSQQFFDDLRAANSSLVLCPFDNDAEDVCKLEGDTTSTEERITQRLKDEDALAYIEIPAGFEADLFLDKSVNIIYRSNENITATDYILQAVETVAQRMGSALVAGRVGVLAADDFPTLEFTGEGDRLAFGEGVSARAAQIWAGNPVTVDYQLTAEDTTDGVQEGFGQSVPGMGTMFVMFTVFGGGFVFVRERQNWTLQRLFTLPLGNGKILAGLILTMVILGMIQYIVVFVVGVAVGLDLGSDPLAVVLLMLSFTLAVSALTFLIANYIKTEQQAGSLTTLLGLTLAPLGGAWWPLEIVPNFMQVVGHISPVAWAMDGFHDLIFNEGSITTVWPSILILFAYAAVLFIIGLRTFKYE